MNAAKCCEEGRRLGWQGQVRVMDQIARVGQALQTTLMEWPSTVAAQDRKVGFVVESVVEFPPFVEETAVCNAGEERVRREGSLQRHSSYIIFQL